MYCKFSPACCTLGTKQFLSGAELAAVVDALCKDTMRLLVFIAAVRCGSVRRKLLIEWIILPRGVWTADIAY